MSAPSFNPHAPLTAPSCAAAAYDEPMSTPTSPAPSWIRHAICWQVYPLGFCGAPQRREDLTGESYGDADGENVVHRLPRLLRSEERRVGKESRHRGERGEQQRNRRTRSST